MINKQMKNLIEKRKLVEAQNGEETQKYWDLELEILKVSLSATIEYLKTASEDEIFWISEVWEGLSLYWKSEQLIKVMEDCQKKYPKIAKDIQLDIDSAREAMKNDQQHH